MTSETKPVSDELLQRYFDGELPDAERAEVEAHLAGRDGSDARMRLEALGELRALLRVSSQVESSHVDFSATVAAIGRQAVAPVKRKRTLMPLSAVGGFLAAAAALAFLIIPTHRVPTNEAEVESLEVQGALATVFRVPDSVDSNRTTTVIWASLDDDDASALQPKLAPLE